MPPAQGQPGAGNDAILAAIASLKADITTEMDKRFQDQNSTFEERLKPVDDIQATLEQARKNQEDAQRRAAAANQPAWQPKSWDEIPRMVEERATEIARKTLDERERAEQSRMTRQQQEEQEYERQIDDQLAKLEAGGYLPRIGNPNDYNDPGVSARRELLSYAAHLGTPELDQVAGALTELHRKDMVFDSQTKSYVSAVGSLTPLPGKYAPVGTGSQGGANAFSGPSYSDIHNARDLDSLLALAEQRGAGPLPTTSYNETGF